MNYKEIHKTGEGQHLEFKTSFGRETAETVAAFSNASGGTILMKGNYIAMHRNKLLAEAFYLRGDIEKFGTGFFRIQTELKLQDRKYLRESYLQPALNKGLIEMTLPGKPNSRYQKYRLTEKGNKMKQRLKAKKSPKLEA
jgi:predicted HTH transcriptional regulator